MANYQLYQISGSFRTFKLKNFLKFRFKSVAMLMPLLVAGLANADAIEACTTSIVACGCTITEPGIYNVMADLSASQGLSPLNGCIDIDACNVELFTNGFNITGSGLGVGIQVLTKASKVFLEAKGGSGSAPVTATIISAWEYGLKSEGKKVIADFFNFTNNNVGILLNGATNNTIAGFSSSNNTLYGVWLTGGSQNNQINNSIDLSANGVAGIYLGCSTTGPSGTVCQSPKNISSHNFLFDLLVSNNAYGIALELGSSKNLITDTNDNGNTIFDLFDGNPSCDANIWRANLFTAANQSCIQ